MSAPPPADVAAVLTADTLAVIASRAGLSLEIYENDAELPPRARQWLMALTRLKTEADQALDRLSLVRSCQFIQGGSVTQGTEPNRAQRVENAKKGLEVATPVCTKVVEGGRPETGELRRALEGLTTFVSACTALRGPQVDITTDGRD